MSEECSKNTTLSAAKTLGGVFLLTFLPQAPQVYPRERLPAEGKSLLRPVSARMVSVLLLFLSLLSLVLVLVLRMG